MTEVNVNTSTIPFAVLVSALILVIAVGGMLGFSLAGILVGAGMSVAGHE